MTFSTGTGHTAYFTIPIIVDVATKAKIRPSRPLSAAIVASQLAVVASPVSAVVLFVSSQVEKDYNISYLTVLAITIPSTFLGAIISSFFANKFGCELNDDPEYQKRLNSGKIKEIDLKLKIEKSAKFSVIAFFVGMLVAICYAIASSKNFNLIKNPPVDRTTGIVVVMLATAMIIVIFSKIDTKEIQNTSIFKNGMVAAVCVMGTAWMGNVFAYTNLSKIKILLGDSLIKFPFLVAILFLIVSALVYSHAAAAKIVVPLAFALGVSPLLVLSAMPMLNGYFLVPNYPTMIAATQMDYTGSTLPKGNKFNQPFLPVCLIANFSATIFAFFIGFLILR
jgi:anaerobic C4-dicarboxylate transporter DcuA